MLALIKFNAKALWQLQKFNWHYMFGIKKTRHLQIECQTPTGKPRIVGKSVMMEVVETLRLVCHTHSAIPRG